MSQVPIIRPENIELIEEYRKKLESPPVYSWLETDGVRFQHANIEYLYRLCRGEEVEVHFLDPQVNEIAVAKWIKKWTPACLYWLDGDYPAPHVLRVRESEFIFYDVIKVVHVDTMIVDEKSGAPLASVEYSIHPDSHGYMNVHRIYGTRDLLRCILDVIYSFRLFRRWPPIRVYSYKLVGEGRRGGGLLPIGAVGGRLVEETLYIPRLRL